jgi:hypothetical protein
MRGKQVALLLLLMTATSVVSGTVASIVTVKLERLLAPSLDVATSDDGDDATPVLQRATLLSGIRAPKK